MSLALLQIISGWGTGEEAHAVILDYVEIGIGRERQGCGATEQFFLNRDKVLAQTKVYVCNCLS